MLAQKSQVSESILTSMQENKFSHSRGRSSEIFVNNLLTICGREKPDVRGKDYMEQLDINSSELPFAEIEKPKTTVLSAAEQPNGLCYFHIRKPGILN